MHSLSPNTCHAPILQGCPAGNRAAPCPLDLALGNGALSSSTLIPGGCASLALPPAPCQAISNTPQPQRSVPEVLVVLPDVSQEQGRQKPGLAAVVG